MAVNLSIKTRKIGHWEIPVLAIDDALKAIAFPVIGIIGNSVTEKGTPARQRAKEWKQAVAVAAKDNRGAGCWDQRLKYTLTIGFAFYPPAHRNQRLDIDNFVKPCQDAVAAGLFCSDETDAREIRKFNYPDSKFVRLFIQRLPNVDHKNEEGAAFYVTATT